MNNLSHLKPGKCKDKAGVSGGVSTLDSVNVDACDPSLSTDGANGFTTQRITENPRKATASKGGRSFDIC